MGAFDLIFKAKPTKFLLFDVTNSNKHFPNLLDIETALPEMEKGGPGLPKWNPVSRKGVPVSGKSKPGPPFGKLGP